MAGRLLKIVEWLVHIPNDPNSISSKAIITSPSFPIDYNGTTTWWKLTHEFNDRGTKHISLYLQPVKSDEVFDADFDLIILDKVDISKVKVKHSHRLGTEWPLAKGWGEEKLISQVELLDAANNFTDNGMMHFVVLVREVPKTDQSAEVSPNSDQLKELLFEMTIASNNETVQLKCSGGQSISALKKIICSKSEVFQKMFDIDMTEKSEGSVNVIEFDSDVMSELLHFVYFGSVRKLCRLKEIDLQLYEAAKVYLIDALKKVCIKSISSRLCIQNVQNIVNFAHVHDENELYESCFHLIYIFYSIKSVQESVEALANDLKLRILSDIAKKSRSAGSIYCKLEGKP